MEGCVSAVCLPGRLSWRAVLVLYDRRNASLLPLSVLIVQWIFISCLNNATSWALIASYKQNTAICGHLIIFVKLLLLLNLNNVKIVRLLEFIIWLVLGDMFYYGNSYTKSVQYLCQYMQKTDSLSCSVIGWI